MRKYSILSIFMLLAAIFIYAGCSEDEESDAGLLNDSMFTINLPSSMTGDSSGGFTNSVMLDMQAVISDVAGYYNDFARDNINFFEDMFTDIAALIEELEGYANQIDTSFQGTMDSGVKVSLAKDGESSLRAQAWSSADEKIADVSISKGSENYTGTIFFNEQAVDVNNTLPQAFLVEVEFTISRDLKNKELIVSAERIVDSTELNVIDSGYANITINDDLVSVFGNYHYGQTNIFDIDGSGDTEERSIVYTAAGSISENVAAMNVYIPLSSVDTTDLSDYEIGNIFLEYYCDALRNDEDFGSITGHEILGLLSLATDAENQEIYDKLVSLFAMYPDNEDLQTFFFLTELSNPAFFNANGILGTGDTPDSFSETVLSLLGSITIELSPLSVKEISITTPEPASPGF